MIGHLRGTVIKGTPGHVTVDVGGVGYRALMPVNDWDRVLDGATAHIFVSTYVREDRLDLYGFLDDGTRTLFEELIELNGIGPRMGLELCAVPRSVLSRAIAEKDPSLLQSIKGIGRKTAEKLLLELSSLAEREPQVFVSGETAVLGARYDRDTVAALSQLGFATQDILQVLETLPGDLTTTEERIAAALRAL